MILTCPACASRYVVDDASVGPAGRMVRCNHCRNVWRAEPPDAPLQVGAPPEPVETLTTPAAPADLPGEALPKQFRARVQEAQKSRRFAVAGAVWGGMAVLVLALLGLAVLFRTDVARAWPKTASLYAALGLPVNVVGLAVENVTSAPGIENGREVLVVGGDVRNVSDRPQTLPRALRLQLLDKEARVVASGEVRLKAETIPVEQARPFTYRFVSPPPQAVSLRTDFVVGETGGAPEPQPAAPAGH
jgi:predicted Zn finger-like uncharacterized protein